MSLLNEIMQIIFEDYDPEEIEQVDDIVLQADDLISMLNDFEDEDDVTDADIFIRGSVPKEEEKIVNVTIKKDDPLKIENLPLYDEVPEMIPEPQINKENIISAVVPKMEEEKVINVTVPKEENIKIVKENDPNEKMIKVKIDQNQQDYIPILNNEPIPVKDENELIIPAKMKKEKEEKVVNVNIKKEKEEKKINASIPKQEEKVINANIDKNKKDDEVDNLLNKDGNTKEIHAKLNKEDAEALKNDDENNPLNSDDPKLQIATSMKLLLASRKGIEKLMAYIPKDDMLIKTKSVIQELLIKLTQDYNIILDDPDKCKEIAKKVYELIITIKIYIKEKEDELLSKAHTAEKDSNITKEIKKNTDKIDASKNKDQDIKKNENDTQKSIEVKNN